MAKFDRLLLLPFSHYEIIIENMNLKYDKVEETKNKRDTKFYNYN